MMKKIWMVAARDFSVTISNKGFLFGILIMPLLITILVFVGPRILNAKAPTVVGQVAIMDQTGSLGPALQSSLAPLSIALRRSRAAGAGQGNAGGGGPQGNGPPIPNLTVVERSSSEDVQTAKQWLIQTPDAAERHLALIVVHADAVKPAEGKSEYGSYDLYVAPRVDENTENVVYDGMREALVSTRLKGNGIDQSTVEASMRVSRPPSVTVGATGERETGRGFARLLPIICGVLLFMGVMTGGPMLMSSTVEEKSSRVVEVLLAAVSPLELMWGKLLGQMGVSLLAVVVYVGLGLFALVQYSMFGLLDPMLIVYLVVFYLLAYLVYGALMMSIGAAVNQAADAQSLMGPVMILLIAPYALAPMVAQNPNSVISVAFSFVPPLNSFVMLARLASGTPPPLWQVFGAIASGILGASLAVWFAAKVFKIGLLMQGKPPSFATLVKWARMA
ncbi:MAG TPA: ABC transporter permease [Steroidobacteraceae bacterium]|jgi:ABC-2 type transport system permease protein